MASSEGACFRFDEELLCGGAYGGLVMEELGEQEGLIYGSTTEVAGFRASGMCGSESSSTMASSGGGPSASRRAESGEAAIDQKRRASNFISGCLPENGAHEKQAVVSKKARSQSCNTLKARKGKLSDRITALQQLVSPFGKADTASVLHEAMGYIKFLHDQVQVLSSPYLQMIPSIQRPEGAFDGEVARYDLRGRGLCLVPVSCTGDVASSNGADFWAPAVTRNGTN